MYSLYRGICSVYSFFTGLYLIFWDILRFNGYDFSFKRELKYVHELGKILSRTQNQQIKNLYPVDPPGNIYSHNPIIRSIRKSCERPNLESLNGIICINKEAKYIDVGANTTFHDISKVLIPMNLSIPINPGFSSITVGGALSGVGIDSSSIKWGLIHDQVLEADVLTADNRVYTVSRQLLPDIFYAIPNSYGSLNYLLRIRIKLIPIKPYVNVYVSTHDTFRGLIDGITELTQYGPDFSEAIITQKDGHDVFYKISGEFTDVIDHNNTFSSPSQGMFYHKIQNVVQNKAYSVFYMTSYDYYWRWDGDMFWGTGIQCLTKQDSFINKTFRKLTGRVLLNSRVLRRVQSLTASNTVNNRSQRVVQDLGVPTAGPGIEEFYEIVKGLGISPLWLCPLKTEKDADKYLLWPLKPNVTYCDIGIFGKTKTKDHNYLQDLEENLFRLDGVKCFYSDNKISERTFDKVYNGKRYDKLKKELDPTNKFKDLRLFINP